MTVGITCFNAEKDIGRAIESAKSQSWSNMELLVVDDASTDNSAAFAELALRGVSNARLIRRLANGGVASARNTLLTNATGEFIAFFDDDDVSHPDRLAVQVSALQTAQKLHNGPVLCFASGERDYGTGYRLQCDALGSKGRAPSGKEVIDYLLLNERVPDVFYGAGVPSCALMAPVKALREIGGYDETLGRVEDVDIAIRLALAGALFIGCPEKLYVQRATLGSDKTPSRNLAAELRVLEKHKEWLESRGLYTFSRSWFEFRESWFSGRRVEALARATQLLAGRPFLTLHRLFQSGPSRFLHECRMAKSRERPK